MLSVRCWLAVDSQSGAEPCDSLRGIHRSKPRRECCDSMSVLVFCSIVYQTSFRSTGVDPGNTRWS